MHTMAIHYIIANYYNTLPLEKMRVQKSKKNYIVSLSGGRLTLLERLTGGFSTVAELLVVSDNGNSMMSLSA